MTGVTIRDACPADAPALFAVYHAAVHGGTGRFYSDAQRQAWSPSPRMAAWFPERLRGTLALVAEDTAGAAGFIVILPASGHLDLFYVRPDRMGTGLGLALYEAAMDRARALGLTHFDTTASHLCRRFLERRGWRVTEAVEGDYNGQRFQLFDMGLTP